MLISIIRTNKATTLVELLFYFVLVSVLLFSAMSFTLQVMDAYGVAQTSDELQFNADFIVEKLRTNVHGAESIDVADSLFDVPEGRLSLQMVDAEITPVVFYVTGGNLYMEVGGAEPTQVNTQSIQVDALQFHHATYDQSPDVVVMDGTLSIRGAQIQSYTQGKTFHLTLALNNF